MQQNRWWRLVALLSMLSLIATACGGDDGEEATDTTAAPGGEVEAEEDPEGLTIGALLPETGGLAEVGLGEPQFAAFQLAIDDINAAGGVLGNDVNALEADETGDESLARENATRLLNEGADALVGAASSGMTQAVLQLMYDNQVPQCSGSATSPELSEQENAEYFYRTVPPDEAVAPLIADTVAASGAENVVIAARADDYGRALADLVEQSLTDLGATVPEKVVYDPDASTFDAEVQQITGADPDAVVVIGFGEAGPLIAGLLESGVEPDQLYGGDGLFGPGTIEAVDPSDPNVIDGMTVIGAAGGEEFNQRLADEGGVETGNYIYGGQVYDCTVILALAAQAADSVDEFADEVIGITEEGTECESFEECKGLLEDGEDIDYQGVSGPLALDENGDPTVGRYATGEYQDGELVVVDEQDVDVTEQ